MKYQKVEEKTKEERKVCSEDEGLQPGSQGSRKNRSLKTAKGEGLLFTVFPRK